MGTKPFQVTDRRGLNKDDNEVDPKKNRPAPASLEPEITQQKIEPSQIFCHPSAGRIVVQEDKFEYTGRIIIPEQSQRRPTTGMILEIGKGVEDYEVGQHVVYGLYSGTVVEFKGWDPNTRIVFRVLGQDEVLCTIDDKAPEFIGVGV